MIIEIEMFRNGEHEQIVRSFKMAIVRTLREDQPLRLLLNLLFYHFNHSEPTYKSQCIKLLDVIAACNRLNVNKLVIDNNLFYFIEIKLLIAGN